MKRLISSCFLLAVIALSVLWAGMRLHGQRAARPVPGLMSRSKAERAGHARGIVQVDLMRQIMADRARSVPSAAEPGDEAGHCVPSQASSPPRPPSPSARAGGREGEDPGLGRPGLKRAGGGGLLPGFHLHGMRHPPGRAGAGDAAAAPATITGSLKSG